MPAPPRSGESKSAFIGRCVKYLIGEGKSQDQALGQCYGMWRQKHPGDKKKSFDEALLERAETLTKQTVQGVHAGENASRRLEVLVSGSLVLNDMYLVVPVGNLRPEILVVQPA
jgi:hypothetical protein